jgi:WD40 repeat protein
MTSTIRRLATLAVLLPVVAGCSAVDEQLTRLQIAKAGKAATALVEVKERRRQGNGSAFCIHPSGWFVTNAHAAQGELTLVLNPGLKTEKSYSARVVRSDPELELALLRVEGAKDLSALALGSDEGLAELQEVVGFGFPSAPTPSPGQSEHPAIGVNAGKITSLRHRDGRLYRIQVDSALDAGNSGGPVLDRAGNAVGVLTSSVQGGRVNSAIPASVVSRFLARPEVEFNPPRLGPGELHKPARFEAKVTPLLPPLAPLTVELILKAGQDPERTVRMEAEGDRYQVTAVPIPERTGPPTLKLAARYDEATLEARTTDRSFTIGGREVKLGEVRTIQFGTPSRVVLRDDRTIAGAVAGLDAVPVRLGEQTRSVGLAGALEVKISPVPEPDRVGYTLVVRQGEKVYRQSQGTGLGELVGIDEIAQFRGHGHSDVVVSVAPDGRRILSGSRDRTMILWDRETGQVIRRFKEQGGWIQSVAIAPDGRRALSGGEDTILRLWDLESGDVIREFRGHTEWIFSVAFSPDGRLAYSTSGGFVRGGWQHGKDAAIRVWDVETGREVRRMEGHRGIVRSVAVSPDGRRILSGGRDSAVILWDAETGAEIRRFHGHGTDEVVCVAFLPDDRRAVSGGGDIDRTIRVWDVETGQEIHRFRGLTQGLTWLAVSPDGRRLISSHSGGPELLLWDLDALKPIHRLKFGAVGTTSGVFIPDGLHAAWGGGDGLVRLYRLSYRDPARTASVVEQPDRPAIRSSRRGMWLVVAALGAAVLAVIALILYLYVYRCQRGEYPRWGSLSLGKPPVDQAESGEPEPGFSSQSPGSDERPAAEPPDVRWNLTCPNPNCGHSELVSERFLGRKVRCPDCEFIFRVENSKLKPVIEPRTSKS